MEEAFPSASASSAKSLDDQWDDVRFRDTTSTFRLAPPTDEEVEFVEHALSEQEKQQQQHQEEEEAIAENASVKRNDLSFPSAFAQFFSSSSFVCFLFGWDFHRAERLVACGVRWQMHSLPFVEVFYLKRRKLCSRVSDLVARLLFFVCDSHLLGRCYGIGKSVLEG